jgi:hypothetical protein
MPTYPAKMTRAEMNLAVSDLQNRLLGLKGPSFEIDEAVAELLGVEQKPYTFSLDTALELVSMLKGESYLKTLGQIRNGDRWVWWGEIRQGRAETLTTSAGYFATPMLAVVSAVVNAWRHTKGY